VLPGTEASAPALHQTGAFTYQPFASAGFEVKPKKLTTNGSKIACFFMIFIPNQCDCRPSQLGQAITQPNLKGD
jgi:hypothetical protein